MEDMFGSRESYEYTVQKPLTWLKKIVLVVAVVAFVSLIWYAAANRASIHNEDLAPQLVEAPKFALKERPEMPGGMIIPHQDKEVFDLLAVTDNTQKQTEENKTELAQAFKNAAEEAPAKKVAEVAPTALALERDSVTPAGLAPKAEVAPIAAANKALTAAVTPAPAPVNSVKGWGVQLGSFQKQSDADNAIKIFNKKFTPMLEGLAPTVRKVQLEKGTFYRVTYVGLENKEAARNLCQAFKQRGQGCLHVNLQ